LPFHSHKIFRLNSTDQPDGRAVPVDSFFYLQSHVGAFKRNERAIRNCCKDKKLQTDMTLSFRQMPNRQQNPTKSEQPNLVPAWLLSASSERQ
jgi:hypothetical protein